MVFMPCTQYGRHKMKEELGFLLIDACIAFNEINHTVMLRVIRHEWPSGARISLIMEE